MGSDERDTRDGEEKALGEAVAEYLVANAEDLRVTGVWYDGTYYPANGIATRVYEPIPGLADG